MSDTHPDQVWPSFTVQTGDADAQWDGSVTTPAASSGGSIEEAGAALMSSLVVDLAEWTDSSWAVAISASSRGLLPICVWGVQPDLQACLDHTASLLSQQPGAIERNELASAGATARHWMPHMIIPISVRGDIRGVLVFGPKKGGRAHTTGDHDLMVEAAAQMSNLLESERLACLMAANVASTHRIRLDLKTAREVQSRFFPCRLSHIQGLDYYGECQPAGDVGGDFVDFIPVQTRALVASVGDVSGTGVSAAIMMSGLQAFLRGLTSDGHGDIANAVQKLNRTICEISPDNFYATLFYARIDPFLRQLQYVSAGHEPALLVRKDATHVDRLESTGTVLGLTDRTTYGQRTVLLEPGDLLIAYTDGISEAANANGRELREVGVLEILRRHPDARASDVVGHIVEAVDRFTDRSRHADDRTVVVVRFTGTAEHGLFAEPGADLALAVA